ncbi:MAG: TRAP transporter small permease [Epsilonproteobacteria bacterium]|nr:TRAP transporter small permease [Campylobacterota bacterium]
MLKKILQSKKDRALWFLNNLEEVSGAVILLLMVLLAFLNVLARYLIHYPLAFTEELETNAFVVITLLGISAGIKRNTHIRVLFLVKKFPPVLRKLLEFAAVFLSLTLFSILFYESLGQLSDEIELQVTSSSLNLPEWIYIAFIPVLSLLIIFRIIQSALRTVR